MTYHYDLISFQVAMQTKRIAVYVANNSTQHDVRDTCISMDSAPDG